MSVPRVAWIALGAVLLATAAAAAALESRRRRAAERRATFAATVPREGLPEYAASGSCRGCHPAQHDSWYRTFHRTMTQYASPETVLGRFDGVRLPVKEGQLELVRRADEFWVRGLKTSGAIEERRIGLLTGSHHMQVYWMTGRPGNTLEMLPYVYLLEDRRWVPARDTFLADPELPWVFERWNDQCLQCHVTAGQPRPGAGPDEMQTRAAELGISCEACHGPGERHVAVNQDPLRRYRQHLDPRGDPTVVNPRRLAPRAASEVCGQCHGINAIVDREAFLREGFAYRPGEPLEQTRPLLLPGHAPSAPLLDQITAREPDFLTNRYWPDGMVRVSGREWNGLVRSPCHQRGPLSCLSCHSMHDAVSPVDQLARGKDGNEACLGCHQDVRTRLAAHTRHAPGSPGSECMNCHMPHTTYGLLKAIRSHEIDSPSVATNLATGRPNACNLCHLDRTLSWAAEHLSAWYGQPAVDLPEDERTVAAGPLYLLRGDAAQRALAAWHMGWEPARRASGDDWIPAFLALVLGDPYSAVRYVAQRSLRRTPALADVAYDYVARPEEIERSIDEITARLLRLRRPVEAEKAARLLMRPDGSLQGERARALLERRDNRSLDLKE